MGKSYVAGEENLDQEITLGRPNEPFWRIQLKPDGSILTGDGWNLPTPLTGGGGTLADGSVTTPKLADEAVTAVKVAGALKDAAAATPSLRSLGTGAQQAAAGDHTAAALRSVPGSSGVFFRPPFSATGSFAFLASDFRLHQLYLPPGSIRRLAFEVVTAGNATSMVRPVLYLPDGDSFAPKTLLLDGGQVEGSFAGVKVLTLPTTAWAGGPVWVGVHHDAGTAPALRFGSASPAAQGVLSSLLTATTVNGTAYRTALFPQGPAPAVFPVGESDYNPPIVGIECY